MKVYQGHFSSKVHFDPECAAWLSSTRNRPLAEVELRDLKAVRYCLVCSPPELHHRPQTHHAICEICGWKRPMPCPHNGGVAVVNIDTMVRYGRDERRVNVRYRWPENVLGTPLADSPEKV